MEFKFSNKQIQNIKKAGLKRIPSLKNQILNKAQIIKKQMISEFNAHPVTREILSGPDATNLSQTLVGAKNGNLFSFIGFESGSDPIQPILQRLIEIEITLDKSSDSYFLNIKMPSPEEIWELTPMPWQEGRSWAKGIESGISGLNYYLYGNFEENSRSGTGVQTNKVRSYARYVPIQYITTLLKKYRTKFSSLYKKNKSIYTLVD